MSKNSKKFRESVKDYNAALEVLNSLDYEGESPCTNYGNKTNEMIYEFMLEHIKNKYDIPPDKHLCNSKAHNKHRKFFSKRSFFK